MAFFSTVVSTFQWFGWVGHSVSQAPYSPRYWWIYINIRGAYNGTGKDRIVFELTSALANEQLSGRFGSVDFWSFFDWGTYDIGSTKRFNWVQNFNPNTMAIDAPDGATLLEALVSWISPYTATATKMANDDRQHLCRRYGFGDRRQCTTGEMDSG